MNMIERLNNLTDQNCKKLYSSRYEKDGLVYYINPITNKVIKENAEVFKRIKKRCEDIDRKEKQKKVQSSHTQPYSPIQNTQSDESKLIEKWLKNPKIDPQTNDVLDIQLGNPDDKYTILYEKACQYLIDIRKLPSYDLQKYLPKNHLIFGSIDLLYFNRFVMGITNEYDLIDIYMYFYNATYDKYDDMKELIKHQNYGTDRYSFNEKICLLEIMEQFKYFCEFILNSIDYFFNTDILSTNNESKLYIIKQTINSLKSLDSFCQKTNITNTINFIYENNDDIASSLLGNSRNFRFVKFEHIMKNFETTNILLSLTNLYIEVFDILNFKKNPEKSPFVNLEDKVFKEIEDPLVEILQKIGIDNINIETLDLNDNADTDAQHTYNKNKKAIDMYKTILDIGIFDILKMYQERDMSPTTETIDLIGKNREYFKKNVLDIGDYDKLKCNTNTDLISQDNFDDSKYLLSRLQLMFQLHTKNDDGNIIRTDCFYAPNFYNYVVSRVNNKQSIVNPMTKQIVAEEDIDKLMKIMKVLVPRIEKPIFTKPVHDKLLKINNALIRSQNGIEYYYIYIYRPIANFDVEITNVCVIPSNITVQDTGSADETSETFVYSIFKLFNDGKLLHKYVPKYYDENQGYFKPMIHFNNYNSTNHWDGKSREQQIRMFKHYFQEIKDNL